MTPEQIQQLRDEAQQRYDIAYRLCAQTIADLNTQQVTKLAYGINVDKDGLFLYREQFSKDNAIALTYNQVCDLVNNGYTADEQHLILAFKEVAVAQIARAIYNRLIL